MGFNKLYLPSLENLKQQLLDWGNEKFIQYWINRYAKSDAIIGPVDSSKFIEQFITQEYEANSGQSPK